jgi:hypothetical protein
MNWREKQTLGWALADQAFDQLDSGDLRRFTDLMDRANRLRSEAIAERPAMPSWVTPTLEPPA